MPRSEGKISCMHRAGIALFWGTCREKCSKPGTRLSCTSWAVHNGVQHPKARPAHVSPCILQPPGAASPAGSLSRAGMLSRDRSGTPEEMQDDHPAMPPPRATPAARPPRSNEPCPWGPAHAGWEPGLPPQKRCFCWQGASVPAGSFLPHARSPGRAGSGPRSSSGTRAPPAAAPGQDTSRSRHPNSRGGVGSAGSPTPPNLIVPLPRRGREARGTELRPRDSSQP